MCPLLGLLLSWNVQPQMELVFQLDIPIWDAIIQSGLTTVVPNVSLQYFQVSPESNPCFLCQTCYSDVSVFFHLLALS